MVAAVNPSTMPEALRESLAAIVGQENVSVDQELRALLSHDVFYVPDVVANSVVAPANSEELAAVVLALAATDVEIHVRGGGMSYTDAYTPNKATSVMLDMRRMDSILEINEEDMYVTVEAGCTWAALNTALQAKNLRTPFWGPLSGLVSTIGGGLSQNNAFFGGSTWGTTSESLIALKVVQGDGTIVETGSASTEGGRPFYRYYGPDLTGIFTGDAGAMGIKAEATFRLIRRPEKTGFLSFGFSTAAESAAAMSDMSRAGLGAELFGFDPGLTAMAMSRGTWSDNLETVRKLAKAEDSALAGLKQVAKTAIAGKSIVHRGEHSLHLTCDGRSDAAVDADLDAAREIAVRHGGKEIDNSVAKVVRAAPFGPVDSMVGPNGERWVPTHGIVAHSDAPGIWQSMLSLLKKHDAKIQEHGVAWGFLTCTMASNGFLIEPVLIWPDELLPMHRHYVRDEHLDGIKNFSANPAAREFVTFLRGELVKIFSDYHAVHFQIGKAYPYRQHRKSSTWSLAEAIKKHVDPEHRINPGCLGFDD